MVTASPRASAGKFIDIREDLFIIGDGEEFSAGFDGEGRWFNATRGNERYRRGMNGVVTRVERSSRGKPAARPVRLPDAEAAVITEELHARAFEARDEWREGDRKPLRATSLRKMESLFEKALSWDSSRYADHVALFRAVYGDIPVLPPDQYLALYLQPVIGCRYNQCGFCSLYDERRFHVRSDVEWRNHLAQVRELFGAGLSLRHGLFLGDANALDMEADVFEERLITARKIFPEMWNRSFAGVAAFQDAFGPNIPNDAAGYVQLTRRGLRRIYIGLESGCQAVRKLVSKPGSVDECIQGISIARQAGLSVGLMIIAGLGGREFAPQHVVDTLRAIDACGLSAGDRIFISPLEISPDSPYKSLPMTPLSATELDAQEQEFRTKLPSRVAVMSYRVRDFLY